jgi:hypothetical protein
MILFSVTIDKTRRKKNWNKDEEEISTRVYTNSTPMTSAKRTRGMSRGFHERQWGCCHLSHTKFVLLNHQYHNFHIVSFHFQVCHTTFWCIVRFGPHVSLAVLSFVKRGLADRWVWKLFINYSLHQLYTDVRRLGVSKRTWMHSKVTLQSNRISITEIDI